MKYGSGGTDMWCPQCKKITTCKAIPGRNITEDADDYAQRRYHAQHPDLNWFQRGRKCLYCGFSFLTGEMKLSYLFELAQLREALSDLKEHAESYTSESKMASESLNKLTASLEVLRALKVYKES